MKSWFGIFLLVSFASFGQPVIEGRVVDKETGKPVAFASIGVVGTARGTSSNLSGQFSLAVMAGSSIKVTCVGYESLLIESLEEASVIQLAPKVTELSDVVIFSKEINARKVVRKAFSNLSANVNHNDFLQNFFYRHYCKDNAVYGRLIEASVDVWKERGYRSLRPSAGEGEGIRVNQLRRSLDKTAMSQGHVPLAVGSVLQADMLAYQTSAKSNNLTFFSEVSNLKTDFEDYTFEFVGGTTYDGQQVYEIRYAYKKDSLLTTTGFIDAPRAEGTLFITTDTFAFVKTEETKYQGRDTVRTSAYYRKYDDHYYPYHLVRDGKNYSSDHSTHWFHIELMSVEIRTGLAEKVVGQQPTKADLVRIPYDSVFWTNNTILKTTPLEDDIITDLGGGQSLNHQFQLYREFEQNLAEGGVRGEEKFNWLRTFSEGRRPLFVGFWTSDCASYLPELEATKRLNKLYGDKITFVLLSLDTDEVKWKQTMARYNLFADGIVHYRIGENARITSEYKIKDPPKFVLVSQSGTVFNANAKHPNDPMLEVEFKAMMGAHQ